MSEKQFTTDYSDFIQNDKTFIKRGNERLTYKEIVDLLNELSEENNYLKKRIKVISDELYCKDRKLEELGVPIECCHKK